MGYASKGNHGFPFRDRGEQKNPIRFDDSAYRVPPTSAPDGRIIGRANVTKGVDKGKAIKHDGVVLGGSITGRKKSVDQKTITKVKPRVLG